MENWIWILDLDMNLDVRYTGSTYWQFDTIWLDYAATAGNAQDQKELAQGVILLTL